MMDEKCVMNSYFGIGIDAKITLDFHMKREEHPEKCRSRARNYMWYGVLGSKEWLQVSVRCLVTEAIITKSKSINESDFSDFLYKILENLQELGTASSTGMRWNSNSFAQFARYRRPQHSQVWYHV